MTRFKYFTTTFDRFKVTTLGLSIKNVPQLVVSKNSVHIYKTFKC